MTAVVLLFQLRQRVRHGVFPFHGLHQLSAGDLVPGGGDQSRVVIVLAQQLYRPIQLGLRDGVGTGQDDGGGGFDLVIVELTEVLHIDLDLARVRHRHRVAQLHLIGGDLTHGGDHFGELAYAGRLDDHPVRVIGLQDLLQRLAEVAHQRAADAPGVHLRDVDARVLEEAAVDADLAKLVLDQHQLLAGVGLLDHLLDERGLARAQEAAVDIDLCHCKKHLLFQNIQHIIPHRSGQSSEFPRLFRMIRIFSGNI